MLAHKKGGGFEQGAADVGALAGPAPAFERRENADHAEHAAGDVDDRRPGAQRPAGGSGHVREAAHHLGDFIEGRALFIRPG